MRFGLRAIGNVEKYLKETADRTWNINETVVLAHKGKNWLFLLVWTLEAVLVSDVNPLEQAVRYPILVCGSASPAGGTFLVSQ